MNGRALILTEASSQRKYKRGERSLELHFFFHTSEEGDACVSAVYNL